MRTISITRSLLSLCLMIVIAQSLSAQVNFVADEQNYPPSNHALGCADLNGDHRDDLILQSSPRDLRAYIQTENKGLMNAIASLQEKPRRCSLATESEVFSEEVRQLLYGKSRNKYRVLFTIREDIVYVLFVRHTSQALLTEDDLGDED